MNIPIFFASDNNYAVYLAIAIKSVCENTKSNIDFYILDDGIDEQSKKCITNIISNYKNFNLEFIKVPVENPYNTYKEILFFTKAVYLRFLIPYLKPQIKKAVYLDIDIIANIDIKDLYNENLDDNIIGAVYEEFHEKYHLLTSKRNLNINKDHKYFNSGVLLIDCEKWRENNINEQIRKAYEKLEERIFLPDQDLLNVVFSTNKYKMLDKKYNYFIQNPYTTDKVIYHYDGCIKPWDISMDLKSNIINYIDIWWKYAEQTSLINTIKDKCKYKDKISFRIARAKKAYEMLNQSRILEGTLNDK